MSQRFVESTDGTPISVESEGDGRPLVLVSGALFASQLWQRVLPLIGSGRRVELMDRRGRGKSGDQPPYAPERELEDLFAVLASLPGPVDLLGHSSGAIIALQVAARAPSNLARLIVYEPQYSSRKPIASRPTCPNGSRRSSPKASQKPRSKRSCAKARARRPRSCTA